MRQIVLDTETTGLDPKEGHRIIEIGCVELIERRLTGNNFHCYLQPDREIDDGAIEVHGITNEFLADKPRFNTIAEEFINYIKGAELVIHNAAFDVGFIDNELQLMPRSLGVVSDHCKVLDTLLLARKLHPGQRNSLDALCKRYEIDNSHRELHGALLDAEILADVYLFMTGGQTALVLASGADEGGDSNSITGATIKPLSSARKPLKIICATESELATHAERLQAIEKNSGLCIWTERQN